MGGLLEEVGLGEEAKSLFESRLSETESPYYFMSWLADLENEAGNLETALDWSLRAYSESQGPYTRFQWGSGYVRDLLDMAPEDSETIESESLRVLEEVLAFDDAFASRNQRRFDQLDAALAEWGADHPDRAEVVGRLRARVGTECERFSDAAGEESERARCVAFSSPPSVDDGPST